MKTALFRFGITCSAVITLGLVWVMTGCHRQPSEGSIGNDVIAMVEGVPVTCEDFEASLARRVSPSPSVHDLSQVKQEVLTELIRFEVLYQQALAAGYDQSPEILSNLKRMMAAEFLEDQLAGLQPVTVQEEEIEAYYHDHPERFGTPARVRAAIIEIRVPLTAIPEKRAEYRQTAEALLAEARLSSETNRTFGLLAQQHSEDQASRYRGGDIGWLTLGTRHGPWDPELLNAIFQLTVPGSVGPVVETPKAFYLVKLIDHQPARMRPLEEVGDGIEFLVTRQKEQAQLETLHLGLQEGLLIRTNQALLNSLHPSPDEPRPPDLPRTLSATARTP